jgi:hypothetical protein
MKVFDIYPLILAVILVFLLGWLLPKSGKTYDVFKLHLDLFPNWFKWIGIIWFIVTFLVNLVVLHFEEPGLYFLLVNANFSLFVILFSKEKQEDEFSEQVRLKAFVYAFVSFAAVIIIYGAIQGSGLVTPTVFSEFTFVLILMGIAHFLSLIYFYITVYLSKNQKEK